jgi:glycosyltransferase involved in cell wall biosynthesis
MKSGKIGVSLLVDTVGVDAGTERLVAEIAKRINPNRFDVHLCCLSDSERFQQMSDYCRIKLFPAQSFHRPSGIQQIVAMRRYLRTEQIAVAHSFMVRTAILGVAAGYRSGCTSTVTTRMSMDWYTRYKVALFRYYLNPRTTRVMANSEAIKEIASRTESLDPSRIDVMYQGVDTKRFAPYGENPSVTRSAARLGIPVGAAVVGIVANYRPVKDLPLFLRAAKIARENVPHAAFLLVGKGECLTELRDLARELGIADSVFFTNGEGDVRDHLASMSIACLSSVSEGFSNAILEYMASGLPVITTAVGGNGEAVLDGQNGYLVCERSPEAFAAPIIRLLKNEELRRQMASNSLQRARELFSMDAFVLRLERYYERLVGRRTGYDQDLAARTAVRS